MGALLFVQQGTWEGFWISCLAPSGCSRTYGTVGLVVMTLALCSCSRRWLHISMCSSPRNLWGVQASIKVMEGAGVRWCGLSALFPEYLAETVEAYLRQQLELPAVRVL